MNFNSKKIIFIILMQCMGLLIHAQVSKVPDGILFQAIAKDQLNPAHSRTVDGKRIITPQAGTSSWTGASSTSMTTFTGLLVQSFLFLYFCEVV